MLSSRLIFLNSLSIVLASKSPRRKEILDTIGLLYSVCPSHFDEDLDKSVFATAADYVRETARQKALEVYHRISNGQEPSLSRVDLVISADTIVVSPFGVILEKPIDDADGRRMLNELSGRCHQVITSVTLIRHDPFKIHSFDTATDVEFCSMTDDMIASYVSSGEGMDKAGGYGIQGLGGTFVSRVNGCYFNIVGLSKHHLCDQLLKFM